MATARPPSGGESPQLTLGVNLTELRNAPRTAGEAARATTQQINQAFRSLAAEQRVILEQQRQITAVTRAEGQVRVQGARAESIQQQQAARVAANAQIEEQRRVTAQFKTELRQRQQAQSAFGQNAATFAGAALGGPLGGLAGALAGGSGALAAGLAVGQAGAFAGQSIQSASNLTEAINKTTVAFAESSSEIVQWSQTSATALGQSQQQALEAASGFGLMFRSMGLNTRQAVDMSETLVQLAADLASINNATPEEALTKLRAGIVGEIEPLRTWGVLLDETTTKQKALQMGLANSADALTQQDKVMARYALILEQTALQQGDFARTSGEMANQQRILASQWADFQATLGTTALPAATLGMQVLNGYLAEQTRQLRLLVEWWERFRQVSGAAASGQFGPVAQGGMGGFGSGGGSGGFGGGEPSDIAAQEAQRRQQQSAINERFQSLNQVSRGERESIAEVTRQSGQQRAQIIANYEKQIAREAADFARQRANAERKLQMSILDVAQDAARQRVKWEQDTERIIAEAHADTAERVAELRADSAEKVAEIEEDFAKSQEKRARDHSRRLRDAVANLDAVALREEQRRFREENQEAKDAHEEQVADAEKSLQKAIDDQNKALAKQEQQQRDSLQRRIEEQAENDRLRIQEMKDAFEAQKTQEDEERGIRLARQAEDHQAQLTELDNQAAARIDQIKDHAQAERNQIEEEFKTAMVDAGYRLKAWEDYLKLRETAANAAFDRAYGHMIDRWNSITGAPVGHPSLADPYIDRPSPIMPNGSSSVSTSTRSSTVNIQPGAITIVPPPNANYSLDERFAAYIHGVLADFFEGYPQ